MEILDVEGTSDFTNGESKTTRGRDLPKFTPQVSRKTEVTAKVSPLHGRALFTTLYCQVNSITLT